MHIYQEENKIIITEGKSQVWIEAWGANSLRVRMIVCLFVSQEEN